MRGAAGISRRLLRGLSCLGLLSGCQSAPVSDVWISPQSSMLAVDVLFPEPLNRDPSLVQAWFLKGPVPEAAEELPELTPATFVKWSRAYLLDPEPGAYSLVAVAAEFAPPWNDQPIDGITQTTSSGISSDAIIFPAELIRRTTTAIAPGRVAFMGLLQVRRGDRISADAVPADVVQKRIADRIRPGVTSQTGIRAWLARARVVDEGQTTFSNQPADREAFFEIARADLGDSPWAAVLDRQTAPPERPVARAGRPAAAPPVPAPAPAPQPAPEAVTSAEIETPAPSAPRDDAEEAALAPVPIPEPEPAVARATPPEPAPPPPAPVAAVPEPEPFSGIPADSPLAQVERGMRHDQVLRILGTPDGRHDRLTARAWIPFSDSQGANLREWIYAGKGRVVFSLYHGSLEVVDVVYDPSQEE